MPCKVFRQCFQPRQAGFGPARAFFSGQCPRVGQSTWQGEKGGGVAVQLQLVAISRREGRYSQIGLLQISRSEVPTGNKTFPRSGSIALFPGATASYRWSLPRACRSTHPPGALLVEPERSIRSGLRRRSRPLPRSRERRAFPRAPSPRHGWNRRSRACPGFP